MNVAGDPANQIAGPFFIVFGERKLVNMLIQRPPQVVHDPLPNAGSQVRLQIGAERSHYRDYGHSRYRESEDRELVVPRRIAHDSRQPSW